MNKTSIHPGAQDWADSELEKMLERCLIREREVKETQHFFGSVLVGFFFFGLLLGALSLASIAETAMTKHNAQRIEMEDQR